MKIDFTNQSGAKRLMSAFPGASTVLGMLTSSDIGSLLMASSNNVLLPVGTTADIAKAAGIIGILRSFEGGATGSTSGSTTLCFFEPILVGDEVETTFSTSFSTALPGATDIGKYLGFSNTTTVAGAAALDMDTLSNVRGTTSGSFFKISSVDVTRRKVTGTISSSHLAL